MRDLLATAELTKCFKYTVLVNEMKHFATKNHTNKESKEATILKLFLSRSKSNNRELKFYDKSLKVMKNYEMPPRTSFINSNSRLFQNMSVYNNLRIKFLFRNMKNKKYHQCKLLRTLGLLFDSKKKVKRLAEGKKQRLYLAMGLADNPELLVWENAFAELNQRETELVKNVLYWHSKERKMTILMTGDRLDEIFDAAYVIGIMENGSQVVEIKG